jgi:hypothetical protein
MDIITFGGFEVFTYNQAANIVLLGIRVFDYDFDVTAVVYIFTSILSYFFAFGMLATIGKCFGSDRRFFLMGLGALQMSLMFGAARLCFLQRRDLKPDKHYEYGIIVMLALVTGSQAVFERSVYVPDLWNKIDPFMKLGSVKLRNGSVLRRILHTVSLIAGTLLGCLVYGYESKTAALCVIGGVRAFVMMCILRLLAANESELEIELGEVEMN